MDSLLLKNLICAIITFILFIVIIVIILKISKEYGDKINKPGIKFFIKQIQKIPFWVFVLIGLFISSQFIEFSDKIRGIINGIILLVVTVLIIKISSKCLNFSLEKALSKDKTAKKTIETIINVLLRGLGIFIFLMNIGVNLTPLITGLGIAGIAVAFALQNILTDLFSSFSILLSKPFIVGDLIKIGGGDNERIGTVKEISLKSTTLITVQGQEVIIPNSNILNTEVINYRVMNHRRQRINIGVTYDTSYDKLKNIPEIIKNIILKQKDVSYERCHLENMGDFSINFLVSYDILDPDYHNSLIINEKIYLELVKAFEKEGIEFAFPSQTLYLKK